MTPDQKAAHQLLTELRTRITTQPLPYQYGVEGRALESLREIFVQVRSAIEANPGCEKFALMATDMLNVQLRPVTAKWHRARVDGWLDSRDGADEFRGDLSAVRETLRKFAEELHQIAYGGPSSDKESPPAVAPADIDIEFAALSFGIAAGNSPVTDKQGVDMNDCEAREVDFRRRHHHVNTDKGIDAVGLALSGGGIRSASFGLGVA